MIMRSQIVQRWHECLAESLNGLSGSSIRVRWIYRTQVRLYRFLLNCYGNQDWRADEAERSSTLDAPPVAANSSSGRLAATEDMTGKPPKSLGEIRAVLKHVQQCNNQPSKPGPLIQGIRAFDWVPVACDKEKQRIKLTRGLLRNRGIRFRQKRRHRKIVTEVQAHDLELALELLGRLQRRRHQARCLGATQRHLELDD